MAGVSCENLKKIKATMTPEAAALLTRLKQNYRITKSRGKKANREVITFSRITIALPHFTCMYLEIAERLPVSPAQMNEKIGGLIYPRVMMHLVFASMIPRGIHEEVEQDLMDAHLLHQTALGLLLNKNDKMSQKSHFVSCENFAWSAKEGDYTIGALRFSYMKHWGILTKAGDEYATVEVVKVAAAAYRRLKRKARSKGEEEEED